MGAVTTPRTVSEAKYAYWHTIVDLCNKSGIPKVEWCRSNCISIKTFNHYEGIFERQERRSSYYKGSYSQTKIREKEVATTQSNEEVKTPKEDRVEQPEQNLEVSIVETVQATADDSASDPSMRIGRDPERYFEIPMSGDHYYIGRDSDGNRKVERYTETEAEADAVIDTEVEPIETEPLSAGPEVMPHSPGTDTSEGITIEADGFKLTIGTNVSEESLRNILKVVQGNA